jgi:predicted transcriptional regulator of viral defense system
MRTVPSIRPRTAVSADRQIINLARRKGIFRARDLNTLAIPRRHLARMLARGTIMRSGRGVYALANANASQHRSLAEAEARVRSGVVCLLSSLRFHGLTTQNPWEVWLAITPSDRKPRIDHPPVRIVRFSGRAYTEGVEHHHIDGVNVKIYSPAKTIADCFKYRNKIGIDVAIESLRDAWRKRQVTADQLWRFATICRVTNVMRPYLETVTLA